MKTLHCAPLLLSIVAAGVLTACKEPAKPADFTPPAGQDAAAAATTAPGAASPFNAPVELPARMRAIAGSAGRCNLERVNGTMFRGAPITVSKGTMTSMGGWFADTDAKNVPGEFQLRFVSGARAWRANVSATETRADVQKLLGGDAAYARTGHAGEFDLSGLPDGTYRVYTAFRKDGKTFACDNGRTLVVGP